MNADPGDCQPITVLDGRTHTVDFAFDPASSKYNVMSFADFGQFSSDKRADILLTSREDYYTGEIAVTVVDGATHQIRWSITPT
jgi:hypothetical protein